MAKAKRPSATRAKKILDDIKKNLEWANFSEEEPRGLGSFKAGLSDSGEDTTSLIDDTPNLWETPPDEELGPRKSRVADILLGDAALYRLKNDDYATEENPFFNFEFSANLANCLLGDLPRTHTAAPVVYLLCTKIARLVSLGLNGKTNFESTQDTLRDIRCYAAILEDVLSR